MAQVKFTKLLNRFFPNLEEGLYLGDTIREVIIQLENQHPGISSYILDDQHKVRKHVNIFLNGHQLEDKDNLDVLVDDDSEIYILQALSGG